MTAENITRTESLTESLRLSREALQRNIGTITEQDWRDQVARYERRLADATA